MPYATAPDGLRLYYEAAGTGRPVLLMTGAFGTLEAWHESGVFEALAAERRVIACDLRGHGRSGSPHDAAMYGWPKNASDAAAVLEHAEAQGADVFGQSMGGQVVVAMLHGDLSRVRSLACNGAYPLVEPLVRPVGRLLKRAKTLREQGMAGVLADSSNLATPGDVDSPGWRERTLAGDAAAFVAEAEGQAPMEHQHMPPQGPPMLMLAGEYDTLAVQTCAGVPARAPYARYRFVAGEGHFLTRKRDLLLPMLREFWADVDSAG
jgi:pimeloyl-ACP methyl ester carboxylesterase